MHFKEGFKDLATERYMLFARIKRMLEDFSKKYVITCEIECGDLEILEGKKPE